MNRLVASAIVSSSVRPDSGFCRGAEGFGIQSVPSCYALNKCKLERGCDRHEDAGILAAWRPAAQGLHVWILSAKQVMREEGRL